EAQSLTAAARRLGLSPSVMSRQIAALESRLGARLFHRTTRQLSLTDAGARYLERARRILADLDEAERAAQSDRTEPSGRLSVTAPLIFGRLHVAPLLARFVARHPKVSVEITLSDRFVNLVEEGHDLAIRIGHLPDSQLIARRFGETRRALVASPSYAAKAGIPRHPDDLLRHDTIAFMPGTPPFDWQFRDADADLEVSLAPRFVTNSGDTAIALALDGAGIARVLYYQVRDAVREGRLVEVLAPFAPAPMPIHAVYPSARFLSGKVRAFVELVAEMADWHLAR
ncbi:MAG: LysR substrate-binding domain-containing protein, partial [Parvibaculaceae bacterium]